MEYEVTEKGITNPDKPGEYLEIGTRVEFEGKVPAAFVNKVRKVAVINPASEEPVIAMDRSDVMAEVVAKLSDADFTDANVPDVRAINKLLPDEHEDFTAAERDELWQQIKDTLEAGQN